MSGDTVLKADKDYTDILNEQLPGIEALAKVRASRLSIRGLADGLSDESTGCHRETVIPREADATGNREPTSRAPVMRPRKLITTQPGIRSTFYNPHPRHHRH